MKIALGFLLMVGCTVAANLLMKVGATPEPSERLVLGVVSWKLISGLAFFGCAALIYAWLLRFLPLNVAQCFAAVQFVAIIFASAFVLSEPIPLARWIGIAFILGGIALVSTTVGGRRAETPGAPGPDMLDSMPRASN